VSSLTGFIYLGLLGSVARRGAARRSMIAKEMREWTEYVKIANIEPQ
jgi:hypothetical protein